MEVNEIRAERLAKTHDPLALMINSQNPYNYQVFHPDQPSQITYMQQPQPNNNFVPQPSLNINYMQQLMSNPKDISDPTTAMNMALILMAKAFKLNYSTPTKNNHRISSNPRNRYNARQIVGNQNGYNAVQNIRNQVRQNVVQNLSIQNVGNQNGLIIVPGIANQNANQNGNGNVVAAQAEVNGNGNNGDIDEIEEVNANCILMANLQQASTSGAELPKPITEPHPVQQNTSNVIFYEPSVEHNRGTMEQHPASVEETCAYLESLYNNLVTEVEKVNTANRKMNETNANLTTKLARHKGQEKCFEFNQEKFDKLESSYKKLVYQEQCLTKKINALHLSSSKQITTLNEEIANLNNQFSKEKSIVSYLQEERKKLKDDFKTRKNELFDKLIG
nr:hypothetical protein [Tanacetum cinerariifolium]